MKGKVFAGICHWPLNPHADMHGLCRFAIRTSTPSTAQRAMERYGVRVPMSQFAYTWGESVSRIEQAATEPHYGEVLTCRPSLAYLDIAYYEPAPGRLKITRDRAKGAV